VGVGRWLRRARGSVRLRVTLMAAGAFAIVLVAASFVLLRSLERALENDVRNASEALLQRQAAQVLSTGIPAGAQRIDAASGEAFEIPVSGAAEGGRVVVVMRRTAADQLPNTGSGGAPSTDVTFVEDLTVADPAVLGIEGPVEDYSVSSLRVGEMVLATAAPLDEVREVIATTGTMFWVVGPALVALVAVLAWLLAGRALRPVHAVTSRVASIGSHSLNERVPVPRSSDEIAELATTMNDMLGRLEAASESSRRLVSDASHELRTPVTVMRTELEVASRAGTAADWTETSEVLLAELDRLQALVDDLLLLARGHELDLRRADVEVLDVVHEVVARRRRVPVEVSAAGPVMVRGDETALRRALDHLVANAARHARSAVSVAIGRENGRVAVHVDDDGPGIAEPDRPRVVQRFVRLDEGRARDAGGAGLGLAIANDVAVAHGGALVIGTSPMGGARVSVLLPEGARP
jgi:signal transduction histidine kinase